MSRGQLGQQEVASKSHQESRERRSAVRRGIRSTRRLDCPSPRLPSPREAAPRPTTAVKPCPSSTRSKPHPVLPTRQTSPGAWCTISTGSQIIENEAVVDLFHVDDEGFDSFLRQAGTDASHESGNRRRQGWREGAGGADHPAHLLCSSAHFGTSSTLSTGTCTWQPMFSGGHGGGQLEFIASRRTAVAWPASLVPQGSSWRGVEHFEPFSAQSFW